MGMIGRRLNLRCFVDGIEIPVIGTRATTTDGAAATLEVQVVPTDEIYDIEPRAAVTVYYYETYDYDRDPGGSVRLLRLSPHDLRRWKLLYFGEFITVAFNKQASGRAASLICVDHTNYWDFIKQHYVNFSNAGIELFENAFMGVKMDRIKNYDIVGADLSSNLFVWLTKSKGTNGKPNLYLGVQRTLREMWFASNDFYARAFNRLRVGDMLVGLPDDQSAAKLHQLEFFEKFIKEQVGGGGGEVTVRMMMDKLLGEVYHNYVTVLAPMFDRRGQCRGFSPSSNSAQDQALLSENIDRSKSWPEAALNYTIIKPDTWFSAPPACNVFFPHQYSSLEFSRNYIQEPTRLFMRTSLLFSGSDKWLTERFYAPDFEAFNQQLYKEGGYLRRMAETVLDHENFVGLNPAQSWVPDLTAYVQKGARRDYLARLSDYLFWKMRFSTRSINLSGPFNPNVVAGYPALILNNVARPDQITRHYVGHVQTVTHVINQDQGGWTHVSLTGAYVHDEVADFDAKGRSLEEVANRGTDGFRDDRYDSKRIGPEVYQRLFGCNSIYETYSQIAADASDPLSKRLKAFADAGYGNIPLSVEALHGLYQRVVKESADVDAFTQSITWRPKANLLEMMGTNIVEQQNSEGLAFDRNELRRTDSDLVTNDGFLATCVDPEAETTIKAEFTAVVTRTVPVSVQTVVPEISVPIGNESSRLVLRAERTETSTTYNTVTEKTKGNYQLAAHLEARRAKVKAYVDSLRLRGLRG